MCVPVAARLAAVLTAAVLTAAVLTAARPALGWSDRGHFVITGEAVERLPDPLRGLFAAPAALERLKIASAAPDQWRKADSPHYSPQERPKHFFNIDALTPEPHPFANFPRRRADAEKQFGPDALAKNGTAPWAADDALTSLVDALTAGRTDDVFASAGELAHYAADLHMPLHVVRNYDGQLTGNEGVHKALEIGLIHRHLEFYAAEVRKDRAVVPYVRDPVDRLFDWLIVAYSRCQPILEADTEARAKTGYKPAQFLTDLDDLESARAKPYYAALKAALEARGSPEAAALRDASAHVAELLYTAWVRAGKPVALAPKPKPAAEAPPTPYWLIVIGFAALVLLMWPRRRSAR